ncbi:hypothetical protein, partial [Klebsiella pneumoniae]|uniref:hypothetical protein n=1 Tax=Klebsiella pneumoniae TaxID=573 RepID=UPI0037A2F160
PLESSSSSTITHSYKDTNYSHESGTSPVKDLKQQPWLFLIYKQKLIKDTQETSHNPQTLVVSLLI